MSRPEILDKAISNLFKTTRWSYQMKPIFPTESLKNIINVGYLV